MSATGGRAPQVSDKRALWALAALTLLAAAIRFSTLDIQSLWGDEVATADLLRPGLWDTLSQLPGSESAPPLYYVLLWGWTKLFGTSAVDLRALSAVFGTLTIPIVFLAARRASERAGLWAAAIATVSPLLFYYSQEARAYALLILLAGLGFVCWQRAMEDGSRRRLVEWAVVSALALATHYFAVFLILPEAIWLLRRYGIRRLAIPFGGLAIIAAALLPLALRQRSDGKSDWIEDTSLPSRIAQMPKQFVVGLDGPAEILTAVLALLCAVAAIALLVRRGSQRERDTALGAAVIVGAGVLLPLLLSLSGKADLFNGRNVVGLWVPAASIVAVGLGVRAAPRLTASLGGAICVISVFVLVGVSTDKGYQRDDWRGAAQAVDKTPGTQRIIVMPHNGAPSLALYLSGAVAYAPKTGSYRSQELIVVSLRERRTGRASLRPVPVTKSPPGFRLAGTRVTSSYAVARFVADRPTVFRLSDSGVPDVVPGDVLEQDLGSG